MLQVFCAACTIADCLAMAAHILSSSLHHVTLFPTRKELLSDTWKNAKDASTMALLESIRRLNSNQTQVGIAARSKSHSMCFLWPEAVSRAPTGYCNRPHCWRLVLCAVKCCTACLSGSHVCSLRQGFPLSGSLSASFATLPNVSCQLHSKQHIHTYSKQVVP